MFDKLQTYTYVPTHLHCLGLKILECALVKFECHCRSRINHWNHERGNHRKFELIFKIQWYFKKIFSDRTLGCAFLDIVVVFDADTAFVALRDFFGVVLETLK